MVMVHSLQVDASCFTNTSISSIDCNNVRWVNNSMYNAFQHCSNLSSVNNISNSVTNIIGAFDGCSNLSSISYIPSSVTVLSKEVYSIYGYGYYTTQNDDWILYLVDEEPTLNSKIIIKTPFGIEYKAFYKIINIIDGNKFIYTDEFGNEYSTIHNLLNDCQLDNLNIPLYESTFINSGITSVPSMSNNIHQLRYVFVNCINLTDATTIPSSVTDLSYSFINCSNLVNVSIPNNVTNLSGTFINCESLVTTPTIPSSVSDLDYTFDHCSNLVNVTNLPNSITTMKSTFKDCISLNSINNIPNSVINMHDTFNSCIILNTIDALPSNVSDLSYTFYDCRILVNIPTIPNSVTNICHTFDGCQFLSDVRISSTEVSNAHRCFYRTFENKNVYIPFKYENGVNTVTYNTFIEAGYDKNGSLDEVFLKDINAKQYTLTINPTPSDATVTLTAEGYTQLDNSITVEEETLVEYTVEKEGYITQYGSKIITSKISIDIELEEYHKYKYGDRIGDIATIVGEFNANDGKKYAYAVLDAKYMDKQSWSSEYVDTGLNNYESTNDARNSTESATYNTDYILNNYSTSDYPAFSHCNNISVIIDGIVYKAKLPNAYELKQIYDNKEDLYSKDPTKQSYTNYNLSEWSFNEANSAWCSNEYNETNAFYMLARGLGSYYDKTRAFGVIPILEILL